MTHSTHGSDDERESGQTRQLVSRPRDRRENDHIFPPLVKGRKWGCVGATGGRPGRMAFAPTIPLIVPFKKGGL